MRILVYSPSLNDVSIFHYQSITPPLPSLSYAVFGLPPSIVSLALGDLGVEEVAQLNSKVRNELTESNASRLIFEHSQIPDNIVLGVSECQKRCNITVPVSPNKQSQPRVSATPLPANYPAPAAPSTSPLPSLTFN